MTARAVLLVTAGVATLGLCVYLWFAVNATPAEATPTREPEPPKVAERERPEKPASKRGDSAPLAPVTNDAFEGKELTRTPVPRLGEGIDLPKDEVMASANKAYDRGNLDEAIEIARKVLETDPRNTRMLRIVVSASCILDDKASAQKHYLLLPAGSADRETMRVRCERYNMQLNES